MFGGPTGIGALIVRKESAQKAGLLSSCGSFVGGGSVDIIAIGTHSLNPKSNYVESTNHLFYRPRQKSLASALEHGTLPLHQIYSLPAGFEFIEKVMGGWRAYGSKMNQLRSLMLDGMKGLKYNDGRDVCRIYQDELLSSYGQGILFYKYYT